MGGASDGRRGFGNRVLGQVCWALLVHWQNRLCAQLSRLRLTHNTRARQLFPKVGCDDVQMLGHIEDLLKEYESKGLYTPGEEYREGNEEDWVDDGEMETD